MTDDNETMSGDPETVTEDHETVTEDHETMSGDPETLTVNRHDQLSRYEGRLGTELVAVVDYVLSDSVVVITHTGTEPAHRGHGYAAQITRAALEDIRASCRTVRAECPFTAEFLAGHSEFDDLLA